MWAAHFHARRAIAHSAFLRSNWLPLGKSQHSRPNECQSQQDNAAHTTGERQPLARWQQHSENIHQWLSAWRFHAVRVLPRPGARRGFWAL